MTSGFLAACWKLQLFLLVNTSELELEQMVKEGTEVSGQKGGQSGRNQAQSVWQHC